MAERSAVTGLTLLPDGMAWVLATGDGRTKTLRVPQPLAAESGQIDRELEARTGLQLADGPALVPLELAAWMAARRATRDAPRPFASVFESLEDKLAAVEQNGDLFVAWRILTDLLVARPGA